MLAPPEPPTRRQDPVPAEATGGARRVITLRRAPPARFHGWSLWTSVALHLLLIPLLILVVRPRLPGIPEAPRIDERVEYLDLADFPVGSPAGSPAPPPEAPPVTVGSTAAPPAAQRRRETEPLVFPSAPGTGISVAPVPSAAAPAETGAEAGAGAAGGSGDRLRPGFRDARLYVDPEIEALRRTDTRSDHQRYMEHLRARINAANDSAYAEARQPDTDWTTRDKEGRRWGVSEKGLHLGGVTIPREVLPLPRATGSNQKQEEERKKLREHEEIKAQEAERERRKAREESTRSTRERKEAERKKGSGGGG